MQAGLSKSCKDQVEALTLAFWSPGAAIDRAVSIRSPWLIQAVLLALQAAVMVAAFRFVSEFRIGLMPNIMDRDFFEASVKSFRAIGYVMIIMTGLRAFLWWYLCAGLLSVLNLLLPSNEQPFSHHFSLAVLASTYSIFSEAHLVLVWYVRGIDAFRSAKELQLPIGLNLIPIPWPQYWYSFMGHLNTYELASTVVLAYGFVRITGSPRFVSYLSILTLWLGSVAIRSSF